MYARYVNTYIQYIIYIYYMFYTIVAVVQPWIEIYK